MASVNFVANGDFGRRLVHWHIFSFTSGNGTPPKGITNATILAKRLQLRRLDAHQTRQK